MYYSLDTAGYHSHLIGHIYACACGTRVNTKPTDLWYAPISNEYNIILCMIEVSDIVQSSQEYGNAWKKMTWWDTLSISICFSISLTDFHRLCTSTSERVWVRNWHANSCRQSTGHTPTLTCRLLRNLMIQV